MLVPMVRVDVVAPRTMAGDLMRAIHRAGVLHLVPFEPASGRSAAVFGVDRQAVPGPAFDEPAAATAALAELIGIEEGGRVDPALLDDLWTLSDDQLLARVHQFDAVRDRASVVVSQRSRLAGDIGRLRGYRQLVEGLADVVGRLPAIRGYGSTAVVVHASYRSLIGLLRSELEALTEGRCELVAGDLDRDRIAAILIYPARLAAEVRSLLGGRDLEEVTLPEELLGVPLSELGPRLESEQADRDRRAADCERELNDLRQCHGATIVALRYVLADRVAESAALRAAGLSEHLLLVSGWIPAPRVAELRQRLADEVGPQAIILAHPIGATPAPDAPVTLQNRGLVRAFQPLIEFVSTPRYGSMDPTPLIALTFPAFVGLMVGDAGYGIVLLALLLLARWRAPSSRVVRLIWPIGLIVAASTIMFGILFGEWFGDAGHRITGLEPIWIDRPKAAGQLLLLALSIGTVQVSVGLVLGVVNAALLGHRHEVAGRLALLATFLGALLLLAWLAGLLPAAAGPIAVGTLVVALVVSVATLGAAGPIEVIGALGNVLSYARLMAIGLASVMLAVVANRLGSLPENVLVGAIVAGVIHALNIGLGFFDSSIQGLRLHYVEFFTKFLEPGGVPYQPFVSSLGAWTAGLGSPELGSPSIGGS